jgi:hypothetical protein
MAAGLAVDRFASQSVIGGATLSMFVSYGGRRDYFVLFTGDSILGVLIVLLSMGPLETARGLAAQKEGPDSFRRPALCRFSKRGG